MSNYNSRTADKFVVRLPDGVREKITVASKRLHRSMNSQIIAWLEMCLTIEEETGQTLTADMLRNDTAPSNRTVVLESMLRKLLNSGDWFMSAIELNDDVDGQKLEKEVREILEKGVSYEALIKQFEELADDLNPNAQLVVQAEYRFVPHVGDPIRFDGKVWILNKYEVKDDGNAWAHISRGAKDTPRYDCTVVTIEDMRPL